MTMLTRVKNFTQLALYAAFAIVVLTVFELSLGFHIFKLLQVYLPFLCRQSSPR